MIVQPITSTEQLFELRPAWESLSEGSPLRSWDWLSTWWKHYGEMSEQDDRTPNRELFVLAVYERACDKSTRLAGIAPWYRETSLSKGKVIRPLGSGEVCTDHLSILSLPDDCQGVGSAIAQFLTDECDDWDHLQLDAVDADDSAMNELAISLEKQECLVSRHAADSCWIVELPNHWDEYLAKLSKSRRNKLRRAEKQLLKSGRSEWHLVEKEDEFESAWSVLVDLHQRRRQSLGEPGCFASPIFNAFHHEIALRLLRRGQLRLSWLELDGSPAAAEYNIAGHETTYAYQGGLDPERLEMGLGQLSTIKTMQAAIEEGHCRFDYLRGDEPYKAQWRATPHAVYNYRVIPNRRLAKLRGRVFLAAETVTDWVRQSSLLLTK